MTAGFVCGCCLTGWRERGTRPGNEITPQHSLKGSSEPWGAAHHGSWANNPTCHRQGRSFFFWAKRGCHPREEEAPQLKPIVEMSCLRHHSCKGTLRSPTANVTQKFKRQKPKGSYSELRSREEGRRNHAFQQCGWFGEWTPQRGCDLGGSCDVDVSLLHSWGDCLPFPGVAVLLKVKETHFFFFFTASLLKTCRLLYIVSPNAKISWGLW